MLSSDDEEWVDPDDPDADELVDQDDKNGGAASVSGDVIPFDEGREDLATGTLDESFPAALNAAFLSFSMGNTYVNDDVDIDCEGPEDLRTYRLLLERFADSGISIEHPEAMFDPTELERKRRRGGWFAQIFQQNEPAEEQTSASIRVRASSGTHILDRLVVGQTISGSHDGPIWVAQFSERGDYLATAGQDAILRIWTVVGSSIDKKRWSGEEKAEEEPAANSVINPLVYREFSGHRGDIIDISWSKNDFILSASMDETVMLWHVSRNKCLRLFQHSDFVTSVFFHPQDDRMFLSGSFDSRLRLWNILEHKVVDWVQVPTLVTSAAFSPSGKVAIVGLYDGQCYFYKTDGFRFSYLTAIECRNRRGAHKKGRKVTGITYRPRKDDDEGLDILVTTNDSRIRMFNVSNFDLVSKLKGHQNNQLQTQASFSPDGRLVICGSDDNCVYVWRVNENGDAKSIGSFGSSTHKNDRCEHFKAHQSVVTVAMFAPPSVLKHIATNSKDNTLVDWRSNSLSHVILSCDFEGEIKFFLSTTSI